MENKWIKFSEKLPPQSERILLLSNLGQIEIGVLIKTRIGLDRYIEHEFPFSNCTYECSDYIENYNSWMPLPSPPKNKD